MKITILSDNIEYRQFQAEWGLSVLIGHHGMQILLDAGASGLFAQNAGLLGIDLNSVDYSVLSHAHWDHANGFDVFFKLNDHAPLYLRAGISENCWSEGEEGMEYAGIREGYLERFRDRLKFVSGDYSPAPGVWLIPHTTPGLELAGRKAGLYIRSGNSYIPDSFQHEQSLVFETEKGLVIMNSCSHAGADTVIREAEKSFPGKKLHAILGGFHLYKSSEDEVRALADRIRKTGIEHVITGHCTGEEGLRILREELGEQLVPMHSGLTMEF